MHTHRGTLVFFVTLFALTFAITPSRAEAQTRASYFDTPGSIRLVGSPRPGQTVPLLVVLPPTGESALDEFEQVFAPAVGLDAYVVLIPAGTPQRSDYLPDFGRFTGWFDARVAADIQRAAAEQPVDLQRVYLAGFSLGGDLAWALLARHPEVYRGAIVMGSRCSASLHSAGIATLRSRGARVVFAIGSADDPARVRGLRGAYGQVTRGGVACTLRTYDGAHQFPNETSVVAELFRAMFGG